MEYPKSIPKNEYIICQARPRSGQKSNISEEIQKDIFFTKQLTLIFWGFLFYIVSGDM